MKKRSVKFVLFFFFMLPLLAENAKVTFVKGKVEVLNGSKWEPVKIGQEIAENSVLSTGFNSEARIQYKGTVMGLGPLTRITLEKLADTEKKEIVNVYLNTGSVRSKVTHPQDKRVSQTVRNAISVCSVRGTDYTFFDSGKLICDSGAVAVFPAFMLVESSFNKITSDSENEIPGESATVTTEPQDIADFAPSSAVVVAAGQTATIKTSGLIEKPIINNDKEFNKLNSGFTTLAQSEIVFVTQIPENNSYMETSGVSNLASIEVEIGFDSDSTK